jgi:DNA polymerase-3 subunit delta
MSAEKIISDWKKKLYKPLYWLEGEEDFYIDKVMDYAEHDILLFFMVKMLTGAL